MGGTFDRLWQFALERSWTHRPQKADVQAIAPAVGRSDAIIGVHRVVPGSLTSSAVAITSHVVVIGGANPGRYVKEMVAAAPPAYRHSPTVLAVPVNQIDRVELTLEGITIHADAGTVRLTAPAGPNRHHDLEAALGELGRRGTAQVPPTPDRPRRQEAPEQQYPGLWSGRARVDGEIVITREPAADAPSWAAAFLMSAGRAWRRLPRWAQWLLALTVFVGLQTVAAPGGVLFAVLLVVFLAGTDPDKSGERRATAAAARRRPRPGSPEAELAEAGSIEARVAGAACRAWDETVREPSWSSVALAGTRNSFDGRREVDTVIDLALRVHTARRDLGPRPAGTVGDFWQQQLDALDGAALQLGERADALIRHRDQAAELSAELALLAELERLERSALVVDDLTLATATAPANPASVPVADQIAAARQAVGELIDLMTRTRAPLAEPPGTPTL